MSFWGVEKVRGFAVSYNSFVQGLQSMRFGHVVNLIHPLAVYESFDNDETVIIDW